MSEIKKNDILELTPTGYASDGKGVARHEGLAVFISGAIAGEPCRARILKVLKNTAFARVEEVPEPSPERAAPDCPHYPACGGCRTRHMSYAEELRFKRRKVEDALRRIGGAELSVDIIHGAEETCRYRNKVQFPVSQGKIGFYRGGSHDVLDVPDCKLQPEAATALRAAVGEWMRDFSASAYDETAHRGLVRHLYVRTSSAGHSLVCLVVNAPVERKLPHEEDLVRRLRQAHPGLSGVMISSNTARTNVVLGRTFRTLWGQDYLEETLCGLSFRLSVPSFFQVNRAQCEILYSRALDFAGLAGTETVLDLYCGIGTISPCLAQRAGRVIGAEIVPEAVEDAKQNALRNRIDNAEFLCGDASAVAARLAADGIRPDVITVDPPRRGLDPSVISAIAGMSPSRVVYVSCDPATLGRDIRLFRDHGYTALRAEAVDMFPRTEHVETVCLLSKLNAKQHIEVELTTDEMDLTAAEKKASYEEIKWKNEIGRRV